MAPHYQDNSITIHKVKCGPYDNNAYLLVCPQTNESILIDTPEDPGSLIAVARGTDGIPFSSSRTLSCKLHVVHDPQSASASITPSTNASRSSRAPGAGFV